MAQLRSGPPLREPWDLDPEVVSEEVRPWATGSLRKANEECLAEIRTPCVLLDVCSSSLECELQPVPGAVRMRSSIDPKPDSLPCRITTPFLSGLAGKLTPAMKHRVRHGRRERIISVALEWAEIGARSTTPNGFNVV